MERKWFVDNVQVVMVVGKEDTMAFDFSNPDFLKTLYYMMAGAGREIGGGQGVAEAIGAPTQQMIKSQNMMDLIRTLSGEGQGQTSPTPSGTPKATGVGEKSKITIEGSKLDDVAKALSGLRLAQEGAKAPGGSGIDWTSENVPNFLMPR